MLRALFLEILRISLTASIAVAVVLLLRFLMRNRLPKSFSYWLWIVVLARILVPIPIESPFSLPPLSNNIPVLQTSLEDEKSVSPPQSNSEALDPAAGTSPSPTAQTKMKENPSPLPEGTSTVNEELLLPSPSSVSNYPELPASPTFSWSAKSFASAAAAIWLCGCVLLWVGCLFCYIRLSYRLREAVRSRFDGTLGMRVFYSEMVPVPVSFGLFRPKVILPITYEDWIQNEGAEMPDEIFWIISHEKEHIRRFDCLLKPLFLAAACLHWFNPLIWLAFTLFEKDMELSCDEAVLASCDKNRKGYASALLSLGIQQTGPVSFVAFGGSSVKARIEHIFRYRKRNLWFTLSAALCASILILTLTSKPAADGGSVENSPQTEENALSNPDDQIKGYMVPRKIVKEVLMDLDTAKQLFFSMEQAEIIEGGTGYFDKYSENPLSISAYFRFHTESANQLFSLFRDASFEQKRKFAIYSYISSCAIRFTVDEKLVSIIFADNTLHPEKTNIALSYDGKICYFEASNVKYQKISELISPYISNPFGLAAKDFSYDMLHNTDRDALSYYFINETSIPDTFPPKNLTLASDVTITPLTIKNAPSELYNNYSVHRLSFQVAEPGTDLFPAGSNNWILELGIGADLLSSSHIPYVISFRPEGHGADLETDLRQKKRTADMIDSIRILLRSGWAAPFSSVSEIPQENILYYFTRMNMTWEIRNIFDLYYYLPEDVTYYAYSGTTVGDIEHFGKKLFGFTQKQCEELKKLGVKKTNEIYGLENTSPYEKDEDRLLIELSRDTISNLKTFDPSSYFTISNYVSSGSKAQLTVDFYSGPLEQKPFQTFLYTFKLTGDTDFQFVRCEKI